MISVISRNQEGNHYGSLKQVTCDHKTADTKFECYDLQFNPDTYGIRRITETEFNSIINACIMKAVGKHCSSAEFRDGHYTLMPRVSLLLCKGNIDNKIRLMQYPSMDHFVLSKDMVIAKDLSWASDVSSPEEFLKLVCKSGLHLRFLFRDVK